MHKVDQVIFHGCIFQAVDHKFITPEEILQRLPDLETCDETLLAYRYVSDKIDPKDHYIGKDYFLTRVTDPGYGAIYALLGGEIPFPEKEEINTYLLTAMTKLHTDLEFKRKIFIICDKPEFTQIEEKDIPLVIKCQGKKLSSLLTKDLEKYIQNFFALDQLEDIQRMKREKFPLALQRCQDLSSIAPDYWREVQASRYKKFFQILIESGLGKVSLEEINRLETLLPDLFPLPLSDLGKRILLLPKIVQLYVLGLPLIEGYLSDQKEKALTYLSREGKGKYAQLVEDFNRSPETYLFPRGKEKIRNEKDVLDESVFAYSDFDRLTLLTDTNRYYFVRREFPNLYKARKNHWTQEGLPKGFLLEVEKRIQMAEILNLPSSGTILELLTRIEEDKLYQSEFKESEDREDDLNNSSDSLLQLFSSLFNQNPNFSFNTGNTNITGFTRTYQL